MTTLKLTQNSFQINDVLVEFPIAIESLKNILGNTNRVTKKKHNTIYTWDDLGILGYSKNGSKVENLDFSFIKDDFDFSTKQVYNGGSFLIIKTLLRITGQINKNELNILKEINL